MRGWKRFLLPGILAAGITPALAAPNFLGQSGNLVTPDDLVTRPGEFSAAYHYLDKEIFGSGDNFNIFSVNYGFTRAFEGGLSYVTDGGDELLVNLKFRLVEERVNSPSVVVGVADLLDELDQDPGLYLIIGKNLTQASGDVRTETEGRALHGYIGFGTGPYDGLIAGLRLYATPQLGLMAEFAPEGPLTGRDDSFNFGARYAITPQVRLTAGLFDFDNVGFGISFTSGLGRR
jgi:hypothetical protein